MPTLLKRFAAVLSIAHATCALAAPGSILFSAPTASIGRTLVHPDRHIIYATLPFPGQIVALDAVTHQLRASIDIAGRPFGMTLSQDGAKLFVSDALNPRLIVVDADLADPPQFLATDLTLSSLAMGLDGRLFASKSSSGFPWELLQIDSSSGATINTFTHGVLAYYGSQLAISPDRTRLWMANIGLSPTTLAVFNVATSNTSLVWASPHGSIGSNGQHLALSWQGDRVSCANGGGNGGYDIWAISTQTFQQIGNFNIGPYPRTIAYSPDGKVVYAAHTEGHVDQWDAINYIELSQFNMTGEGREFNVDRTGRVLVGFFNVFSNNSIHLRLIDTGRIAYKSADINGDAVVDVDDLLQIILNWGPCADCDADLDWNDMINSDDLMRVLSSWTLAGK